MKLDLTNEEVAVVLDGLASLPLAKSFNTFQKVYQLYQVHQQNSGQISPESVATAVSSGDSCKDQ